MRAAYLIPLALIASAAPAAKPKVQTAANERISTLVVYGSDPCPKGQGDDIVVCARQPESERYRIPKKLRHPRDTGPAGTAWGAQVRQLEYVGRDGLPDTCSVVGSGGQTGCMRQFLAKARAERTEDARQASEGQ